MENRERPDYPDISHSASCTDCTGLMCRPPLDEEEYESYQEVGGMEIPKID
ncbi:MAG: hypothetical protein PHY12_09595 [Eubacteriales bacterium]|nr:hypothetical protein [Eubacteriales bacterium]